MFRHLSPKVGVKEKPAQLAKIKLTVINPTHIIVFKTIRKEPLEKLPLRREKQIKHMSSLPSNQPTLNIPASSTSINKSTQINKNTTQINANTFNDYYEQVPNPVTGMPSKQETSLSGGSYHSESTFNGAKKIKSPKSTVADKCQPKPKNLVNTLINNNNDAKMSFKSPANPQANRSQYQEGKSEKRIHSFGGKKIAVGRAIDDVEAGSKKSNDSSTGNHGPGSPPDNAICKFSGPESLEPQQEKKELCNENKSNEQTGKPKALKRHLPKFIANGHIRSTPYLIKYKSESQNQASDDNTSPKILQKTHSILQQIEKQSKKDHEQERFNSFNREQLFLSLKKRQERHSQLSKQLKKMSVHVQLKIITTEGEKPFEVTFIKKIIECKKTSIYLVYHEKTNSLYCLKRIHLQDQKPQYVENIIREHKIHQFCSNPHIVKAFGTLIDSTYIYLLMEFMEGETLGMELKNHVLKLMSEQNSSKTNNESNDSKILKINRIKNILYEIMVAVAYLHEIDIIHHDIKPDNIFISHNIYKLGDFGSAVIHESQEYVGTLDYAAPQILTRAPYDEKIDIWSLGCIAYELDVGRPPFFHINPQQTRRMITNGQYDRSLITDNQLRHIIDCMLQTNRKMRISARQLLKFQFFRKKGEDSEIS